jgi:hypothetical protein
MTLSVAMRDGESPKNPLNRCLREPQAPVLKIIPFNQPPHKMTLSVALRDGEWGRK